MRVLGLAVASLSIAMVILSFGCLTMNVEMKVYKNGSATGSFSIVMPEEIWNMTQSMNLSAGNQTGFGGINLNLSMGLGSNVTTVKHEGGYVYMTSREAPLPPENFSVKIEKQGGCTYYSMKANMSREEERASSEEKVNLSDPFTQMMLKEMRIQFKVTMPGEIVDSNGNFSDSVATWSYNGLQARNLSALYARSKLAVSEVVLLPAALFGAILVYRRRIRSG